MLRFHTKIHGLIPLLIFILALSGCTRSRPEVEGSPTQTVSLSAGLSATEEEGQPTTIAIQATATPTLVVDQEAGASGEVQPTNTPIGEPVIPTPTPTLIPVTSVPDPTSTTSGQVAIHIVQPGDNLFRIGQTYDVSVNELARFNGIINPNLIYVGQRIKIPGQLAPGGGSIHIVQPGETLIAIAYRYNTTVQALVTANNLINQDIIYIGQRLIVP